MSVTYEWVMSHTPNHVCDMTRSFVSQACDVTHSSMNEPHTVLKYYNLCLCFTCATWLIHKSQVTKCATWLIHRWMSRTQYSSTICVYALHVRHDSFISYKSLNVRRDSFISRNACGVTHSFMNIIQISFTGVPKNTKRFSREWTESPSFGGERSPRH